MSINTPFRDAVLEDAIEREYQGVLHAPTEDEKREHFQKMATLMRRRTAQYIEAAERERGLR